MKKTLKNSIKRLLSVAMVLILLIGAFVGCVDTMHGNIETTPSINWGQDPDDPGNKDNNDEDKDNENDADPTRVFTLDSLEPLSKEKQAEVESVWIKKTGKNLSWCRIVNGELSHMAYYRYYGTYNNCVVICEPISWNIDIVSGSLEIAEQKIKSLYIKEIWIYKDGDFFDVRTAYENKFLTDSDISAIVKYNDAFEKYIEGNE